ncbi:MAG: hemerythrin domain-containing protein, partial [Bryocella sp.]
MKELGGCWQHSAGPAESEWMQAPFKALTEHIIHKHHTFTRQQLDLIDGLMAKVEARHGSEHPEVFKLGKALAIMGSEMRHHTDREEENLFPYLAAMDTNDRPDLPAPAKGNLQMPITHMMTD